MKTKVNGKISKLFMVLLAATLLVLMIPKGAQANDEKVVKDQAANANTYFAQVQVDPEGFQPDGCAGWNLEIWNNGTCVLDNDYPATPPLVTEGPLIPDGTIVGIDENYRLHFYYEGATAAESYDIYVKAKEKTDYEAYAWYYLDANEKAHVVSDNVDVDKSTLIVGEGTLAGFNRGDTINFYAEFIGKVNYKVTGGEGHARFEMDYYINQHTTPDYHYSKESLSSYAWEGSKVNIEANGEIECVNYDDYNDYFECGHIVAVPKDGYKLKSWTVNGEEFPVGKELKDLPITFPHDPVVAVANYEKIVPPTPPTETAKTGDSNAIVFAIIGLIVAAGVCGAFAGRKSLNK